MMNGSVVNVAKNDENDWVHLALEAVGNVIEFWGFKRNQGRVWAYLYFVERTQNSSANSK